MKHYHFYHENTGIFSDFVLTTTDDAHVEPNTPAGCKPYEGPVNIYKQRMDVATGKLVEHDGAPPVVPRLLHEVHTRIAHLELQQPRIVREVLLGYEGAIERLKDLDEKIIRLRAELGT